MDGAQCDMAASVRQFVNGMELDEVRFANPENSPDSATFVRD